jgi:hypothetical protein
MDALSDNYHYRVDMGSRSSGKAFYQKTEIQKVNDKNETI